MNDLIASLVSRLSHQEILNAQIIPWSSPIPAFGDLSKSEVATLGLNPSNREFLDRSGNELTGSFRRFHTLKSLGISRWSEADRCHNKLIWESCRSYFARNPYDGWFKQLDYLLQDIDSSYYELSNRQACHLDLVPYATTCKWTHLTKGQQSDLLDTAAELLTALLQRSPVRVLILNGASVVKHFEKIAQTSLKPKVMPGWELRSRRGHVSGVCYRGTLTRIAGASLSRTILLLGFNHNIQSSFGVTHEVRALIRKWIGYSAEGAFGEAQRSSYCQSA